MTRQAIIERTVNLINQLPENKAEEISDFAQFIVKQYEEHILTHEIQKLSEQSKSFSFLHDDENLYTIADLKKVYNG